MKSLAGLAAEEIFQRLQRRYGNRFGNDTGYGANAAPSKNIFERFVIVIHLKVYLSSL